MCVRIKQGSSAVTNDPQISGIQKGLVLADLLALPFRHEALGPVLLALSAGDPGQGRLHPGGQHLLLQPSNPTAHRPLLLMVYCPELVIWAPTDNMGLGCRGDS